MALSYNNTCLMEEDVSLLDDCQWLNDKLIGFMFEFFENTLLPTISTAKILFISPEVTQFIKMIEQPDEVGMFLEPLSAQEQDLVFFAVNNHGSASTCGGSHWSLLVYNNKTAHFHHFDSSSSFNAQDARDIANKAYSHINGKQNRQMKFLSHNDCSQQTNGYDCGMYVIMFTEELCNRVRDDFSEHAFEKLAVNGVLQKRVWIQRLIRKLAKSSM